MMTTTMRADEATRERMYEVIAAAARQRDRFDLRGWGAMLRARGIEGHLAEACSRGDGAGVLEVLRGAAAVT